MAVVTGTIAAKTNTYGQNGWNLKAIYIIMILKLPLAPGFRPTIKVKVGALERFGVASSQDQPASR